MMSLESIKQTNREIHNRAKRLKRLPKIARFDSEKLEGIPNIGGYRPKGFKLIEKLFVDKTGFDEDGPAMSIAAFHRQIKEGLGYAVIEEGQFQVYVGVFRKL